MEEKDTPQSTGSDALWNDDLARELSDQRSRVKQFIEAQRQKLQAIDENVARQAKAAAEHREELHNEHQVHAARTQQLDQREQELVARSDAMERRAAQVEQEVQQLQQLKQELDDLQAAMTSAQEQDRHRKQELEDQQARLDTRTQEVGQYEERLRHEQSELALLREELTIDGQTLTHDRQQLDEQIKRTAEQSDKLDREWEKTKQQRSRIAGAFKQERTKLQEECQQLREQLEAAQLTLAELENVRSDRDETRVQLDALRKRFSQQASELDEWRLLAEDLQEQFSQLVEQHDQLQAMASAADPEELKQAHAACDDLLRQLDASQQELSQIRSTLAERDVQLQEAVNNAGSADSAEVEQLQASCTSLEQRLAERDQQIEELKQQLTADEHNDNGASSADLEDMQRRHDMLLEDLRAARSRNAQLEAKLETQGAARGADDSTGEALDWEAQKRRLLASLEADYDDMDDEEEQDERLRIEEAVRRTDAVVEAKNREISELNKVLEEQSNNWGAMAVGASAVAELLDKDEIIQQERESLMQLQNEWREKLKLAEVDVSVARATIARERAEIEERTREIEEAMSRLAENGSVVDDKAGGNKKGRNRWLARLGIKDDDE